MYSTLLFVLFVSGAFAGIPFRFPSYPNNRFSEVVVFGDSYSDTGNVYNLTNHTWPIVPPYHLGRYCNGPNWFDNLNVSRKSDYAYGSATTDNNLVQGIARLNTVPVPGIRQQVAMYLNDPQQTARRSADPVYVIWGGGNDFVFNPFISPAAVVNSLMDSVRDLLAIDAENIIVFNSAPFQAYPNTNKLNNTAPFAALTAYLNNAIYTSLQALQANHTATSNLHLFDLNAFITNILNNPPPPITNLVDNCWDVYNITAINQHCPDPTTHLFLDTVHFSSTVTKLLANAVQPFFLIGYTENAPGSYIHSF